MSEPREHYDFEVMNEGTIFLFFPQTEGVMEWFEEHTTAERFGDAFVVEHRYAYAIRQALVEEGFVGK